MAIGVLPCNSAPGQPHATNPLTKKGHNSRTPHRNKRGSNWTSSRRENGPKPPKTLCSNHVDELSRRRQHRGAERRLTCCRRQPAVGRRLAARWRRARVCRTPLEAQYWAARPRGGAADALKHLGNDLGWQRVACEQLRSRRAKLVAHAMTKIRQDKAVRSN